MGRPPERAGTSRAARVAEFRLACPGATHAGENSKKRIAPFTCPFAGFPRAIAAGRGFHVRAGETGKSFATAPATRHARTTFFRVLAGFMASVNFTASRFIVDDRGRTRPSNCLIELVIRNLSSSSPDCQVSQCLWGSLKDTGEII